MSAAAKFTFRYRVKAAPEKNLPIDPQVDTFAAAAAGQADLSDERRTGRSSRMAAVRSRGSSAASPLLPAQTSFDFLSGSFRIDERARVRGLSLIGAAVSSFTVAVAAGLLLTSWNTQVVAELDRSAQTASRLSLELGALSNTGGVGEQELLGRRDLLASHLREAESSKADLLAVVNDLQAELPSGAQLNSLDVSRNEAGLQVMTAQIALGSFGLLTDLSSGLERVWYLRDTSLSWTSGANQVAATVRATIDPEFSAGRASELSELLRAEGTVEGPAEGSGVETSEGSDEETAGGPDGT